MIIHIVIPAFNEERNLSKLLRSIRRIRNARVIVVDDGSWDGTSCVAREHGARVLTLLNNMGTGFATKLGLQAVHFKARDVVVCMDADGQHDPSYLLRLTQEIKGGADFVIGSRYLYDTPMTTSPFRVAGTAIISFWLYIWFKKRVYDPTSGYRAMSPRAVAFFANCYPTLFPEPVAVIYAFEQDFRIKEIKSLMRRRLFGTSSISTFSAIQYMVYILIYIPIRAIKRLVRL